MSSLLPRDDAHGLDEDVRLQQDAPHLRGVEPAQVVLAVGEHHEEGSPAARGEQSAGVEGVVEGGGAPGQDPAHGALETRPVARRRHAHLDLLVEGHQGGLVVGTQPAEQRPPGGLKAEELLARHAAARVEDEEGGEVKRLHATSSTGSAPRRPQREVGRGEARHGPVAVGHEHVHVHALDAHGEGGGRRRLGGSRRGEREGEGGHDVASPRSASSRSSAPTDGPQGYSQNASGCGRRPAEPTAFSISLRARRVAEPQADVAEREACGLGAGRVRARLRRTPPRRRAGRRPRPAGRGTGARETPSRVPACGRGRPGAPTGLGRLAEPPGNPAQAQSRLGEGRVGRDRRAQEAAGRLEVRPGFPEEFEVGLGLSLGRGQERLRRETERCLGAQCLLYGAEDEEHLRRVGEVAQAPFRPVERLAPAVLALRQAGHRLVPPAGEGAMGGSSFSIRAISTATDSWSRGGSRSRRARWAQSLWSMRAARTGNRCHRFGRGSRHTCVPSARGRRARGCRRAGAVPAT